MKTIDEILSENEQLLEVNKTLKAQIATLEAAEQNIEKRVAGRIAELGIAKTAIDLGDSPKSTYDAWKS